MARASSPALSGMASRALAQVAPAPPRIQLPVTIGLTATAALGIAAGLIPKQDATLRKAAIGGSVAALAITALLFAFWD